jgi:hypothetical protein
MGGPHGDCGAEICSITQRYCHFLTTIEAGYSRNTLELRGKKRNIAIISALPILFFQLSKVRAKIS